MGTFLPSMKWSYFSLMWAEEGSCYNSDGHHEVLNYLLMHLALVSWSCSCSIPSVGLPPCDGCFHFAMVDLSFNSISTLFFPCKAVLYNRNKV